MIDLQTACQTSRTAAASEMFARKGVLNLEGLEGSGADWLERFKPYIWFGSKNGPEGSRNSEPAANAAASPFQAQFIAASTASVPTHIRQIAYGNASQ